MPAVIVMTLLVAALTGGICRATTFEPKTVPVTDQKVGNINGSITHLVDETGATSIETIIKENNSWKPLASNNVTFGLQKVTVWLKIRLENATDRLTKGYLEFNPFFLEYITAYDASGKLIDQTGARVPQRRHEAFPTLEIELEPGVHDFYVNIHSRSNSVAVILRSSQEQAKKYAFDLMMISLIIGALASLMIYHLFLFATYRNRGYLLYSLFVASTILFTICFTSFHEEFLPSRIGTFEANFWWSGISACVLYLSIYLFSADLLNLFPQHLRFTYGNRLNLLLLLLPLTSISCIIGIFATDNPAVLVPVRATALLEMFTLTAVAIYLFIKIRGQISLYFAISWLPFFLGALLVVSWLSGALNHHNAYPWSPPLGVLAQSLLLAFAAGQRLNIVTRDKLKEQQDKLRVMDELEIQVKNLERRDRVITAFVSSDVTQELDRNEDPIQYEPRNVEKCIVFLDMHGFTTFSESYSALECYRVLNVYFSLINRLTYEGGGKVDKIIGDAMMMAFDDPTLCLKSIVNLRRNLSNLNRDRTTKNLPALKFGIGISYGTMLSANFGSSHKLDRTLVGDTVNIASRLETITRAFAVDVLCSKEFTERQHNYPYFRPAGYVLLKGKTKKSLVYELFEHEEPAIVAWKVSTKPTIEKVIDLELEGHYVEAMDTLRNLIAACPPHPLNPKVIMDPTLESMVRAIEEKMRQLGLEIPKSNPKVRKAG